MECMLADVAPHYVWVRRRASTRYAFVAPHEPCQPQIRHLTGE